MQETVYTVARCPVHIALVSDLHERPYAAVLASLERERPALICVAGDFLYGFLPKEGHKLERSGVLPFFTACAGIAPCFVSLGNHEWMLTDGEEALLRETGAVLLDDAFTVREFGGTRVVLGGLNSSRVSAFRRLRAEGLPVPEANELTRLSAKTPPDTDWLDDFCAEPGYHILLSHHPEYYPRYLRGRCIELILSGHAHGGQVRLFGRGLFAPGQGFLPRLTSGVVDGRLVISRGLSNRQRVPRLFNPPELVYIRPQT